MSLTLVIRLANFQVQKSIDENNLQHGIVRLKLKKKNRKIGFVEENYFTRNDPIKQFIFLLFGIQMHRTKI